MLHNPIPACRDRSRNPAAKLATVNRRKARAVKSAALFLAFAFPADMPGHPIPA